MGTIVVGVDGSDGSLAALRFALEEARLRDAELRVVAAWRLPLAAYGGPLVPPEPALFEEIRDAAHGTLGKALDDMGAARADVRVETVVGEGQAAHVLLDEARGADLLVVGSRGLGGFRGLLLGSVSQQCAQHAPCPLVIVPAG
jgi:nucleotide-binding universal stress UspA family protein